MEASPRKILNASAAAIFHFQSHRGPRSYHRPTELEAILVAAIVQSLIEKHVRIGRLLHKSAPYKGSTTSQGALTLVPSLHPNTTLALSFGPHYTMVECCKDLLLSALR